MATELRRMMQLRGTSAEWTTNNIVLLAGELGFVTDPTGWRFKVGDGTNVFSNLPFIGEKDTTARGDISVLQSQTDDLDFRVTALEGASGELGDLETRVDAVEAAVVGKQDALPVPANVGDLLYWDGVEYTVTNMTLTQGSMLYWDNVLFDYRVVLPGAAGQALIFDSSGKPVWGNPGSITVTVEGRTITLTGGATVEDAFNTAAPTILPNEVISVLWSNKSYHYVGPPGTGLNTATSADFTQLGNLTPSVVEAPVDGTIYGRKDADWEPIPIDADAPSDGKVYGRKDGAWFQLTAAYDLYFDFGAGTIAANAERAMVLARAITIPADLVGSQVSLGAGDSSAPVFTLYEGTTARGTLTLTSSGGTWAATVGGTPISIAAGQLIRLVAPGTVAAAFTGLRASVAATRT